MNKKCVSIFAFVLMLSLGACSTVKRNPLPENEYSKIRVLDQQNLRYWGDENGDTPLAILGNKTGDIETDFEGVMHREHNYLVISGGGQKGAYSAGLLVGWSELGTRPEFTVVTGVSTGALAAPFAFLGSDYDDELREVFTIHDTDSIYIKPSIFSVFKRRDGALDTSPLITLLEEHINEEMIAALAVEYRRGRNLNIGTTNLDTGRPVTWDITRIAATGHPEAGQLIRDILLASASFPGIFPPVYFKVETADGEQYDEMHVDGGVTTQMFLYPEDTDWDSVKKRLDIKGTPSIYIMRNGHARAKFETTKPNVAAILSRAVNSLIRTQAIGDFYRIKSLARRDGLALNVTWIPQDAIELQPEERFDPEYMNALFEYGYQRMLSGQPWTPGGD